MRDDEGMTERDDTPAIQAAIRQARERPGQPVPVTGTDVTVTWLPGTDDGCATIAYSAGVLHAGGDAPSAIIFPSGAVAASSNGGPVRVTVEGGGFTDAERAAITADLLAGRIMPGDVPPGDGSKIAVTFSGEPHPDKVPVWDWDLP